MDYDPQQTGGNGFIIDFPDQFEVESISHSIRNDAQGIHRLEMISLVEAMEEAMMFLSQNEVVARQCAGVEMYTDRFSVTDGELISPYRIREWRKAGWKNYEGKPIKNSDLLDKIDKTRLKLSRVVGGSVTVTFKRRKQNKIADKLAKAGKKTSTRGVKLIEKNKRRITRRIYDGDEVDYSKVSGGSVLEVRVYAWEPVGEEFEICFEICSGDFEGKVIKTSVNSETKLHLKRSHTYLIEADSIFKHHIGINLLEEIER